jgi:hypothetical protein
MSGGVFCIGFGLAMVALVIFGDRSVKNAKRTGVRVSAQVIGQEVEVGSKGSRFYHTKVRFPGPMGNGWSMFRSKAIRSRCTGNSSTSGMTPRTRHR